MISFKQEDIFLVTGASSGIGRATALLLNSCGASVIANGRNENALKELKAECDNKDNLYIEAKDLLEDIESLPLWIKSLKDKYGKLKGLICSAGITSAEPLNAIDVKQFGSLININYIVPIILAKGFADRRVNAGVGSSIVFLSSTAAFTGNKGLIEYAGSKNALIGSTKSIASELFSKGIRINSILPGFIKTAMVTSSYEAGEISELPDDNIIGMPEDIANIIVFLCSKQGRWINGQSIIADGGSSILGLRKYSSNQ